MKRSPLLLRLALATSGWSASSGRRSSTGRPWTPRSTHRPVSGQRQLEERFCSKSVQFANEVSQLFCVPRVQSGSPPRQFA